MKPVQMSILTILLLLLMATTMQAENYPYRSDVLWVTVPDHADWIYQPGEEPRVEVQFYQYGMPKDGTVTYTIGNDLLEDDDKESIGELYIADDDTIIIDTELMADLDKDLDDFFNKLIKD